jgi:hypothetical protein
MVNLVVGLDRHAREQQGRGVQVPEIVQAGGR